MGMQIVAGRNFDPHISDDTVTSVIVNEEMVKDFGWTNETAIGQLLKGYRESVNACCGWCYKKFQLPAIE